MIAFELEAASIPHRLKILLSDQRKALDDFLAQHPKPTYETLVPFLETQENELQKFWAPISHLNSVKNTDALREAYEACLPLLSEHQTYLSHHLGLFQAFQNIPHSPNFETLSDAEKKYVSDSLRDFKLAGVNLDPERKKIFSEIHLKLSELAHRFEQNLLDASDAWHLELPDNARLEGIPAIAQEQFAEAAKVDGKKGYLISLQAPSAMAVLTYAKDRKLRKEVYEAWVTRASDIGPTGGKFDNSKILFEILSLRQQLAELLGFKNFAEYSLVTKMAKTPEAVNAFLEKLVKLAKPFAQKEFTELESFAKSHQLCEGSLAPWDVSYVSEKMKEAKLNFDDEALRPYFPLPVVMKGLFHIAKTLFGIQFKPAPNLPRWDEQVEAYEVQNKEGETLAYFYCDLFARQKKRGGAWMDDAQSYWPRGSQKPITFLTCNFSPPLPGQPALLTHDDVNTLFHEFGHGLHHMLTEVNVLGLTGTHVEWDAVELPSQLMENWAWRAECLSLLSAHYQTQEKLPDSLIQDLLKSKYFLSGMFLVRQLEFALFDLRIHWKFDEKKGPGQIQAILDDVRREVSVVPISAQNRFQHSFSHIFAGGYAAGYYSYLWAEVLAADAFSLFEAQGGLSEEVGARFRQEILAKGGSADAGILFKNFRGRPPELEALLKSYGLCPENS